MGLLEGKSAIITGSARGIGRATAELFVSEGARVLINDIDGDVAEQAAGEIDGETAVFAGDLTDPSVPDALVKRAQDEFGHVDILVNNAGYTKFVPMNDLKGMPEDEWDRIMDVNVKGIWLCTKAAAPAMRRAGGGAVVNVTSVAGLKVAGSSMAYAVSKAAAIHLTKCLAAALAPDVRVNAVAPGLVFTRWWAHAESRRQQMEAGLPLKRSVAPEEVASTIMELIRNDSITGQTIALDAGALLP
jgi:3-oxoacyl-[acyl-carrier protein] reductase